MSSTGLVLLKGGPSDAPQVVHAPPGGTDDPVKLTYRDGYDHYEFTGEFVDIGAGPMPVYRWSHHTRYAE
ncbi:DUF5988 family protein [Streptomyces gibsoniae]|uniref:DUF5988 family protein n=1 Tax=Streptomyces gibsoniae TaxID=3075529 RepID=A0ABU2U2N6_9ACTN|nr:DUF5988 family protein [Streptomyces sp. DSM 41699]MDT0467477.1 DUF5988 family protein [Streptomyces sp. DSM 41699]